MALLGHTVSGRVIFRKVLILRRAVSLYFYKLYIDHLQPAESKRAFLGLQLNRFSLPVLPQSEFGAQFFCPCYYSRSTCLETLPRAMARDGWNANFSPEGELLAPMLALMLMAN